jgi:uncharacterized FlgJ-related protein
MKLYKFNSKTLNYQPVRYGLAVILILITSLAIMIGLAYSEKKEIKYIETEAHPVIITEGNHFSSHQLKQYIRSLNIRHADIVYAQAVLESNNFKSRIFIESNNLFGMKKAMQRPTTCTSTHRGHAMYSDWKQSVMDYALFQAAFLRDLKTREQYLNYLAQNYAEDPNYVTKLKSIIE